MLGWSLTHTCTQPYNHTTSSPTQWGRKASCFFPPNCQWVQARGSGTDDDPSETQWNKRMNNKDVRIGKSNPQWKEYADLQNMSLLKTFFLTCILYAQSSCIPMRCMFSRMSSVTISLSQCVFFALSLLHWCSSNTDDDDGDGGGGGGGLSVAALPLRILFTECHKHVQAAPPHSPQSPHNGCHRPTDPSAWSLPPAQALSGFPVCNLSRGSYINKLRALTLTQIHLIDL